MAVAGLVEHTHEVAAVGVNLIFDQNRSHQSHVVLFHIAVHIPFRLVGDDRDVDSQRIGKSILIGEVNDVVVESHVKALVNRQFECGGVLRFNYIG